MTDSFDMNDMYGFKMADKFVEVSCDIVVAKMIASRIGKDKIYVRTEGFSATERVATKVEGTWVNGF